MWNVFLCWISQVQRPSLGIEPHWIVFISKQKKTFSTSGAKSARVLDEAIFWVTLNGGSETGLTSKELAPADVEMKKKVFLFLLMNGFFFVLRSKFIDTLTFWLKVFCWVSFSLEEFFKCSRLKFYSNNSSLDEQILSAGPIFISSCKLTFLARERQKIWLLVPLKTNKK